MSERDSAEGLMSNPRYMPASDAARNRSTQLDKATNITGYYVDNDEADTNFTDLQTLFLACFATLVPLVLSVITALVVRCLWRRYRRNKECSTYDGVMHQEGNSDHLSGQSGPLHSHLLISDPMNIHENSLGEGGEDGCSGSPVMYSGSSSRTNHASANGSIITMTLKNNHLIVETEERNDIIEDSRETTMKYSPSAQDGVFVVEVQQGVRREQPYSPDDSLSDQKALVHNPPERFNDTENQNISNDVETKKSDESSPKPSKSSSTYTGLSQSTLSLTSLSPNPSYRYGNQQGYDNGYYGYPVYNGYINDDIVPWRIIVDFKPKITSAVYKENGARLMYGYSIDAAEKQPILLSDIQAKEIALDKKTHREELENTDDKLCDGTSKIMNSISQDSNEQNGYEVA